jgi:hypothetical protein
MFWLHLNDHWCFFLIFVDFILKKVITFVWKKMRSRFDTFFQRCRNVLVPNCLFQRVPKCLGAELSFSTGARTVFFNGCRTVFFNGCRTVLFLRYWTVRDLDETIFGTDHNCLVLINCQYFCISTCSSLIYDPKVDRYVFLIIPV